MRPYDVMKLVERLADMIEPGAEGEIEDLLAEIEDDLYTLENDAHWRGYDEGVLEGRNLGFEEGYEAGLDTGRSGL